MLTRFYLATVSEVDQSAQAITVSYDGYEDEIGVLQVRMECSKYKVEIIQSVVCGIVGGPFKIAQMIMFNLSCCN